jgi:hypothetical protein
MDIAAPPFRQTITFPTANGLWQASMWRSWNSSDSHGFQWLDMIVGNEFPFAGTQVWSLGMVRARKWRVGGEDIHGLEV